MPAPGPLSTGERPARAARSDRSPGSLPILRRLRTGSGLTLEHVAGELQWSPPKVIRMETGISMDSARPINASHSPGVKPATPLLGVLAVTDTNTVRAC